MSAPRLLLYCRAGFEKECAQEITASLDRELTAGARVSAIVIGVRS